ncbi:asparagine synthase (glutamine-hydrolyzing) [Nitrospira moscoviensis]|uniref:asparagine synthase (glutamine-hydrolyzing) n=1 Tax=Nitrospira moscoviensis TaxID=42253 RepID=A0A0K2GB96_NITMO|nr:asparagine synthase (glutamine-hydrolyzing) [Nitrospira moscoviensis]ALA58218.1 Asparagine synthetase [Nitrospira moscoviensis]
MCGLVGMVLCETERRANSSVLERMTARLRHRGPDDAGLYIDGEFGVGVRRLSVLDPGGGHQPMTNEDRTVVAALNGEIYNFRALKAELSGKGYRFRTDCDTEVLLRSYEAYGFKCFETFEGMFAVALWDASRRELILGRDRLGIKPLFYARIKHGLVFASELKALLEHEGVERTVNMESLSHFLTLGYTPGPQSILEGIRQVPPAHYLRIGREGVESVEWWSLPHKRVHPGTVAEAEHDLADLLEQSVGSHLVSDVPVGLLLSGGMDSAVLLALMRDKTREPVKTFTVTFDEPSFDEGQAAREAAAWYRSEHHEILCRPSYVAEQLSSIVQSTDNLMANPAAIPLHLVCKLAGTHVKVLLSGNGGDEVFAGYPTYAADKLAPFYRMVPAVLHDHLLNPLVHALPASFDKLTWEYKLKQFVEGARLSPEQAHYWWRTIFTEKEKRLLFQSDVDRRDTFGVFRAHFERTQGNPDFLNRAIYCDIKTWLADMGLPLFDNIGMAHSVEIRVPFLDHRLIEYSMRLASSLKMPGLRLKHLLKRIMAHRLPPSTLRRPKAGFHVPLASWLCGDLKPLMCDVLTPEAVKRVGLFRVEVIERLKLEHLTRRHDHSWRLWNVLCFFVWQEAFLAKR